MPLPDLPTAPRTATPDPGSQRTIARDQPCCRRGIAAGVGICEGRMLSYTHQLAGPRDYWPLASGKQSQAVR